MAKFLASRFPILAQLVRVRRVGWFIGEKGGHRFDVKSRFLFLWTAFSTWRRLNRCRVVKDGRTVQSVKFERSSVQIVEEIDFNLSLLLEVELLTDQTEFSLILNSDQDPIL